MVQKLTVAGYLPDIELPSLESGAPIPLRPPMGRTTILAGLHSAECEGCRKYIEELGASASHFGVWDARLLIAVPEPPGAGQFSPPFGIAVADERRHISTPGDAAVLVADRFGQIYEVVYAGESHCLPSPDQIEEWMKFLGTLCPECDVPDEPGPRY